MYRYREDDDNRSRRSHQARRARISGLYHDNEDSLVGASGARLKYSISLRAVRQNGSISGAESAELPQDGLTISRTSINMLTQNAVAASVLEILQTRSTRDEDGKDRVNMITVRSQTSSSDSADQQSTTPRWIHLVADPMSLDEFEGLAVEAAHLSKEEVGLTLRLLRRVRKKIGSFVGGRVLEPLVLSYVGEDPAGSDHAEKKATFICVPYFLLRRLRKVNTHANKDSFPTRALFQTALRLQSTYDRDKQQAVKKISLQKSDEVLHMAQLWVLLIDDKTIITYGTESYEILLGHSIANNTQPKKMWEEGHSRFVRVQTDDSKYHIYPSGICQTWFELLSTLESTFHGILSELTEDEEFPPSFVLTSIDGSTVDSKRWHTIVERETSEFIDLYLRIVEDNSYNDSDSDVDIKPPSPELRGRTFMLPTSALSPAAYSRESLPRMAASHWHNTNPERVLPSALKRPQPGVPSEEARHYKKTVTFVPPASLSTEKSSEIYDSPELAAVDDAYDVNFSTPVETSPPRRKDIRFDSQTYVQAEPRSRQRSGHVDDRPYQPPYDHEAPRRKTSRTFSPRRAVSPHRPSSEYRRARPRQGSYVSTAQQEHSFAGLRQEVGPIYYEHKKEAERRAVSYSQQPQSRLASPGPIRSGTGPRFPSTASPRSSSRGSLLTRSSDVSSAVEGSLLSRTSSSKSRSSRLPIFCWPTHGSKGEGSKPADQETAGNADKPGKDDQLDRGHGNSKVVNGDADPNVLLEKEKPNLQTEDNVDSENVDPDGQNEEAHDIVAPPVAPPARHVPLNRETLDNILADVDDRICAGEDHPTIDFYKKMPRSTRPLVRNALHKMEGRPSRVSSKLSELTGASSKRPPSNPLKADESLEVKDGNFAEKQQGDIKVIEITDETSTINSLPLRDEKLKEKRRIVEAAQAIFHAFLPSNWRSAAADKYWAAVLEIITQEDLAVKHTWLFPHSRTKISHCTSTCTQYLAMALEEYLKALNDVLDGVESSGESHYQIPMGGVDAFARILLFLTTFAASYSDGLFRYSFFRDAMFSIHMPCSMLDCLDSLKDMQHQLILMIYTQDSEVQVNYEAVKIDALLGLMLSNLIGTSLRLKNHEFNNLEEVYNEYMSILEAKVRKKATASVFSDIRLLSDELNIASKQLEKQEMIVRDYHQLVFGYEFEKSAYHRYYDSFSDEILARVVGESLLSLELARDEFAELKEHVQDVQFLAAQTIQIQTESQDYAILIFTIVTVIFLPMSFVTSYLGMNTIDIRDTNWSQALFWIVSTPIVVVMLLVVGLLLRPAQVKGTFRRLFNRED